MDREKIALFLTELRKEKQLLQQDLAALMMVSPQAVSKWETGESIPDIETLQRLANFYQITVDEILQGKRKETQTDETKSVEKKTKTSFSKSGVTTMIYAFVFFLLGFSSVISGTVIDFIGTMHFNFYQLVFTAEYEWGNYLFLLTFLSFCFLLIVGVLDFFAKEKDERKKWLKIRNITSIVIAAFLLLLGLLFFNSAAGGLLIMIVASIAMIVFNYTLPFNKEDPMDQ